MPRPHGFAQPCCDATPCIEHHRGVRMHCHVCRTRSAQPPSRGPASKAPPRQSSRARHRAGSDPHGRKAAARDRGAARCGHAAPKAAGSSGNGHSAAASELMLLPASSDASPSARHVSTGSSAFTSAAPAQRGRSRRAQSQARGRAAPSAQLSAEPACDSGARKHDTPRCASRRARSRVDGASQALRASALRLCGVYASAVASSAACSSGALLEAHRGRTARAEDAGRSAPPALPAVATTRARSGGAGPLPRPRPEPVRRQQGAGSRRA